MKRYLLAAIALTLVASAAIAANVDELTGTWRGTSLCTPYRPACHDEIAVYHIAPSDKPDAVMLTANKVVDGKEVPMGGTVEYHVDWPTRTLTWQFTARDGSKGVVTLTWTDKKMKGVMIHLPGREIVRNIAVEKQ